ncbi:hypothetical protein [Ensifer adhaerens]|uniref:hypothetical protein n=1 Tax=Ensifer adhaerens TaxID=106592 RepID=UPI001C4DF973|nr:hypothetical protein [Ensifer adhaerens]MBW0366692.1 hypothetical protein [Ensifer adhaerens]UCM18365.1 hypothetical protein LDL63_10865 [Ensifer adhaerens]
MEVILGYFRERDGDVVVKPSRVSTMAHQRLESLPDGGLAVFDPSLVNVSANR